MMTIEEVIKQLKDLRKATLIEKNYKTFNVAIEVLEKEIPEKTIFTTDYDASVNYYRCPVCGDMVTDKKDEPDYYCSGCGQKLDWEA